MKKVLITLSITAVVALSASVIFSQEWGHMEFGAGHMNNGYGHRGYGYMNNGPGHMGYSYMNGYDHQNGMGQWHMNAMRHDLNLTDSQVDKIFKLSSEYREKFFQNRENLSKVESLRNEHRKAIENVLSKEQIEKYKTYNSSERSYGWFGGCYNL